MFSFFKKKKTAELTQDQKNWNRLWELYDSGELAEINPDIFALCEYESGVNGEGHSGFFSNNEEEIPALKKSLEKILPNDFYENLEAAYKSYETDKEEEICDMSDEYFYENEQKIIDILQNFADENNNG